MRKVIQIFIYLVSPFFFLVFFLIILFKILGVKLFPRKKHEKPKLVWGNHPLQSNQYWSNALKKKGYESETIMEWVQAFHTKKTFDKDYFDIKISGVKKIDYLLIAWYGHYIIFLYAISNFDIFHHHFYGGFLGKTFIWKLEAPLLRILGKKTIISAVGGDFYRYSSIVDLSLKVGFLRNYPGVAKQEDQIQAKVKYWVRHADIIMNGFQVDALARWDIMPYSMVTIDESKVAQKENYVMHNGKDGPVRIIHTPNHRGIKGTEFIIEAVKHLKEEGLNVELLLLENLKNEEVLSIIKSSDILVEQLLGAYGLSAIEGMSSGLCVIANLENSYDLKPFRRYSYLNECPIVSGTPENIENVLRILVQDPQLREVLGKASRKYVEKYHSEKAAQFIFETIYDKIWYCKEDTDLLEVFNPLNPNAYNNRSERISHPLINNTIH